MASVYSNSYVNLVASSAYDSSGGLFFTADTLLSGNSSIRATWTGLSAGRYFLVADFSWLTRFEHGPLAMRGWFLQERMLVPRSIFFTSCGVWTSCHGDLPRILTVACDGGTDLTQARYTNGLGQWPRLWMEAGAVHVAYDFNRLQLEPDKPLYELWASIIRQFSTGRLTYDTDRFPAVAGLAYAVARIKHLPRESYLAGLWREKLAEMLLWCNHNEGKRLESLAHLAPSWSWASVTGEVHFGGRYSQKRIVHIIKASVTPVMDQMGPISEGFIIAKGPLLAIRCLQDGDLYRVYVGDGTCKHSFQDYLWLDDSPDLSDYLKSKTPSRTRIFYLACFFTHFRTIQGLIRQRKEGEPAGQYRRIGYLEEDLDPRQLEDEKLFAATQTRLPRSCDEGFGRYEHAS
ncbi:hypothetical protein H2203_003839 [Taxawa tesnikishii (nom. ined.)]|nr:hypothetical protein H2203_003839 [Dothideales sp. JES 119]